MDDLDRAQELEMESRNAAIANQIKKQGKTTLSHCQDCGDAIPLRRQKMGGGKPLCWMPNLFWTSTT